MGNQAQAQTDPGACTVSSISDTVVVLDTSASMRGERISVAKSSAKSFVQNLQNESNNRVGLVTYGQTATLEHQLTTNQNTIQSKIDSITTSGTTCIECAIVAANNELISKRRSQAKKVVVLLTDGIANRTVSGTANTAIAERAALNAAKKGNEDHDIIYYTIGVGSGIRTAFLQELATSHGGKFYNSPTPEQLNAIYEEIHQEISSGSISGTVFYDENNNQVFDQAETAVPNRKVIIRSSSSEDPITTSTTNELGNYSFSKLCDGTYYVSQEIPENEVQTLPEGAYHTVNIQSGSVHQNMDFGNYEGGINLMLSVTLPGIGVAEGDNYDPIHKDRSGDVEIYTMQNEKVAHDGISFTFQSASQSAMFTGMAEITNLVPGTYYVKVRMNNTLFRQLPGVYTLKAGDNSLPTVALSPGDLTADNILDMSDYSVFVSCYGEKECQHKTQADFNDDGVVDGIDYSIMIRSFAFLAGH